MATQQATAASLLTYEAEKKMNEMRDVQRRTKKNFDSSDEYLKTSWTLSQNKLKPHQPKQDMSAFEEEKDECPKPQRGIPEQYNQIDHISSDDSTQRLRDLIKP